MSKLPEKQRGKSANGSTPCGDCEVVSGSTGLTNRYSPYTLLAWQITFRSKMANGLCATTEVCNNQFGIETVEVRVRGHDDCTLEHCLRFCVYRLKTVRFPMRHGTNNLFKFKYDVTVTPERLTNGVNNSKDDAR